MGLQNFLADQSGLLSSSELFFVKDENWQYTVDFIRTTGPGQCPISWSLRDFLNHRTATVTDFRPNLRFYAIVYEKILERMQSPGPRKT